MLIVSFGERMILFLLFIVVDDPKKDSKIRGDPKYTIFVGRISYETSEQTLKEEFSRYGEIRRLRLVRDIVTGLSKGYAFIEYEHSSDCRRAHEVSAFMKD
mgnify:CR=1 FL=1